MLQVEDMLGVVNEVDSDAKVRALLCRRQHDDVNEFWLSHGQDRYPAIAILMKGDLASLHYFPEGRSPGFRSLAPDGECVGQGYTPFSIQSPEQAEIIPDEFVVSLDVTLRVAQEFMRSPALPACIKWLEL